MLITALLTFAMSTTLPDCAIGQICDITSSVQAAQAACAADITQCDLELGFRDYKITGMGPVVLCGLRVKGQGIGRTRVFIDPNTTGFVAGWPTTTCIGAWHYDAQSEIHDMIIESVGTSTVISAGVEVNGPVIMENVGIRSFVLGLWVNSFTPGAIASYAGDYPELLGEGNANLSRFQNVWSYNSQHAAVLTRGDNSNAMHLEQVSNAKEACTNPGPYEDALGQCASIIDASFLANTWLSSHTSNCNGAQSYRFTGPVSRSVAVGMYAEIDCSPAFTEHSVTMLGGQSDMDKALSKGLKLNGRYLTGQLWLNNGGTYPNSFDLIIGEGGSGSQITLFTFADHQLGSLWTRLKYDQSTKQLFFDYANSGGIRRNLLRTGPTSSDFGFFR